MCSSCFKKHEGAKQSQNVTASAGAVDTRAALATTATLAAGATSTTADDVQATVVVSDTANAATVTTTTTTTTTSAAVVQKNKERCFKCNKRVGLLGFPCKCELVFCAAHRFPDSHACAFDHRNAAVKKIEADNPLIQAAKVSKI